jgi:hypothetical protein
MPEIHVNTRTHAQGMHTGMYTYRHTQA